MWADFNTGSNKISYEMYRKQFVKANIGFTAPSEDDCVSCPLHKNNVLLDLQDSGNSE